MTLHLSLGENSYDIVIERGCLKKAGELLKLDRKVLIVTDDGVPAEYSRTVASFCKYAHTVTLPQGEVTKNFESYMLLCKEMLDKNFTRTDCVVAVGGGVMGDLAGFAAATFMRGIDFYNIPTTLLSQVDSSVGGKTGIDVGDVKNIVGAFKQPKKVLIDPNLLSTLPARQISNGLAESVKMALTCDSELFSLIESGVTEDNLEEIITKSIIIKKNVVEQDEKESSLRRVLNFGHTVGHGIETAVFPALLHGECVALGMLPMCADTVRQRLLGVLNAISLPVTADFNVDAVLSAIRHDKKLAGSDINVVYVPKVGHFEFRKMAVEDFERQLREVL